MRVDRLHNAGMSDVDQEFPQSFEPSSLGEPPMSRVPERNYSQDVPVTIAEDGSRIQANKVVETDQKPMDPAKLRDDSATSSEYVRVSKKK
jgi:hypothetical protein